MTLSDIINTLKHDGTNPSINKEAIVKALEEVNKGEFLEGKDIKVNDIDATGKITGEEIVEAMSGYSSITKAPTGWTLSPDYVGVCKNGNKLTFAIAITMTKTSNDADASPTILELALPENIGSKLIPSLIGGYEFLDAQQVSLFSNLNTMVPIRLGVRKVSDTKINVNLYTSGASIINNIGYFLRFDITFLLSENLAE